MKRAGFSRVSLVVLTIISSFSSSQSVEHVVTHATAKTAALVKHAPRECTSQIAFLKRMDQICFGLSVESTRSACYHTALTVADSSEMTLAQMVTATCGTNISGSSQCLQVAIDQIGDRDSQTLAKKCQGWQWSEMSRVECYQRIFSKIKISL